MQRERVFGYKSMVRVLVFSLFIGCVDSWAQSPSLEIPVKLQVADMELSFTEAYRARLKQESERLLSNFRYFKLSVDRADAYMPIIERILAEEQMPDDLKYLVLQESKLVSDVVSTSNAVGYWQFKKGTAEEMGLFINDEVDERMNICASTRAAARYMKKHNKYLNNIVFSVLSYYAGLAGARSVIDDDFVGAKEMELDTNTHWYVTKFLAHKITYQGYLKTNPVPPLRAIEYTECEGKSLEQLSTETGIGIEELGFYNKWIRKGTVPTDKDYTLILPVKSGMSTASLAVANTVDLKGIEPYKPNVIESIFGEEPSKISSPEEARAIAVGSKKDASANTEALIFSWNGIKAIMAKKGDNINKLALAADINKDDFLEYNDLKSFDAINPGQVYYIKPKRKKAAVPFHTVKEGESLWDIAQNYGIQLKALMKKNHIDQPEKLKAGRIMWLRHSRPENEAIAYAPLPKKEVKQASPIIQAKPTVNIKKSENSADLLTNVSKPAPGAAFVKSVPQPKPKLTAESKQNLNRVDSILNAKKQELAKEQPAKLIEQKQGFSVYEIEPGYTLYSISKKLGVSLDSLRAWNRLEPTQLKIGMPIYYKQVVNADAKTADNQEFYICTETDTIESILSKSGLTEAKLNELNGGAAVISTGKRIRLK